MQTLTVENTQQAAVHEQAEITPQSKRLDTIRPPEAKSILIVFATRYGHTAKIVQQLVNALNLSGHETIVVRADRENPPKPETLERDISCVILGGPLYMGRFPRFLSDFIERYRNVLQSVPSAFFSVSLTAAHKDDKKKNAVHEMMEQFFDKNHWEPCRTASFAGALLYTHYGPVIRFIMRWISKSAGHDTNIHRDYVYTDWNEIPIFAEKIDSMIKLAAQMQRIGTT
jgi:menaquinone-dependent protoporphyrinogen oxidase